MDDIAIYLHWPFCKSKCPYCDFASIPNDSLSEYEIFEDYILTDLKRSISDLGNRRIKSVFFGGGTPSLMKPQSVEKILSFLFKNCKTIDNIEITLEANPATFDYDKMKNFKNAGVNRLSLGIQSFLSKNLKFLGRIYDGKQAINGAEIVSRIFENFSFDLIYGYECQTLDDLKRDLIRSMDFGCRHISCYQLTIEVGTPFHAKLLAGDMSKIDDEKESEFYDLIENVLNFYNIFRYEISNYSAVGLESRHNMTYWRYNDYLGVGPSAHSRITTSKGKTEMVKIKAPFAWKRALDKNKTTFSSINLLNEKEKLEEILITGLRLVDGITTNDLYKHISQHVVDKAISEEKIKFLIDKELMNNEKLQLTKSGLKKLNSVVAFLLAH